MSKPKTETGAVAVNSTFHSSKARVDVDWPVDGAAAVGWLVDGPAAVDGWPVDGGVTPALSVCRSAAEMALTLAAFVSIRPRQWL